MTDFRVAVVVPSLPPVTGGSEVSSGRLVCDLALAGVVVHLLAGNEPTARIRDAVLSQGGSITVVDGAPPPGVVQWEHNTFAVVTALHEIAARHRVRIVHAFSHASALAAAGWPGGISPPGSHRTERDSLPSFRSSRPSFRTRSSMPSGRRD